MSLMPHIQCTTQRGPVLVSECGWWGRLWDGREGGNMPLMLTHALYTQRGPVLESVVGDGVCGS